MLWLVVWISSFCACMASAAIDRVVRIDMELDLALDQSRRRARRSRAAVEAHRGAGERAQRFADMGQKIFHQIEQALFLALEPGVDPSGPISQPPELARAVQGPSGAEDLSQRQPVARAAKCANDPFSPRLQGVEAG